VRGDSVSVPGLAELGNLPEKLGPMAAGLGRVLVPTVEMKLLAWPEHRFVDIGFGLPKLSRCAR
jgi:hypothetical protein